MSATTPVALIGSMGCSVFAHGATASIMLIVTLLATKCGDNRAIRDLNKISMQASLVVLPKSNKAHPDRASSVPVESTQNAVAPAEPVPEAAVKASDLVFNTDKPKVVEAPDRDLQRRRLVEQLNRAALVDSLSPDGPVNRDATDPNSDATTAIQGFGHGDPTDPEWARYVARLQQMFRERFRPLASIADANPGIHCRVKIVVDPANGRVLAHEVEESSGVPSYDAAAIRAVEEVATIPLPPERYRDLLRDGYLVNFVPP